MLYIKIDFGITIKDAYYQSILIIYQYFNSSQIVHHAPPLIKKLKPARNCGFFLFFKENQTARLNCGMEKLFMRGEEGIKKFNSKIGNFKIINDSQNLIDIIDYFNLLKLN